MSAGYNKQLVLTGLSGIIGGRIIDFLKPSHGCTIVTRNRHNFSHLENKGVLVQTGSLENTTLLTTVFNQCDIALVMMTSPPSLEVSRAFQRTIAESLFTALKDSKVKHIVHLSCIGAGRPDKTGIITGSYELERRLNWLENSNVIHLRPALFMEALFQHLCFIPEKNILQSTLAPNVPIPLVSSSDVAEIVSQNLQNSTFHGQTIQHILGPEELTMTQVTEFIGKAAGKSDLVYCQVPREEMESHYQARGYSSTWTTAWLSCFENLEKEKDLFGKTPDHLHTPTTFIEAIGFYRTGLQTLFDNSATATSSTNTPTT